MRITQEINLILLVAILKMTGPAQAHQILDRVFSLAAAHTPSINVMDVNSTAAADFTWNKFIASITKVIKINTGVLLHFQPFFIWE